MALSNGTRLGPYEITAEIGAGGMGEVYRATDSKLGRDVAIKTLPAALADDADRLARFEREAKLLAALNHAHIASVYSLDEHEGTRYLAMELVEGETLEQKLQSGALPVDVALRYALQIAEALEAAHEKGIVHRDLKPANIMVTPDGVVKVLDFGLAKAFSGDPNAATPAHSPALSLAMTQQGLMLGTAGYMSPEQASGQATDQRADVWAFGVVLFEMLTGLPLFTGESVPHVLSAVLQVEPDWSRLPKHLHPRLRLLLERCLKKKVRDRYHGIADARADIEDVLNDPQGTALAPPAASLAPRRVLPIGVAIVGTAALAILVGWLLWPPPAPKPVNRFAYPIPEDQSFSETRIGVLAVSPDGRRFAYGTTRELYLREMSELEAHVVRGTEGDDEFRAEPFFSSDGQSIGYWSIDPFGLRRISANGGTSVAMSDFPQVRIPLGESWTDDGTILAAFEDGIYRIPAGGGAPELVVRAAEGGAPAWPTLLPDGDTLLFTWVVPSDSNMSRDGDIVVQSLSTGERKPLTIRGSNARYVPTGHIVYASEDNLFGVPFDLETLSVAGSPEPLVPGIFRGTGNGAANYGITDDGTLVYLSWDRVDARKLVWVDRQGREESIDTPPRAYRRLELSPDGRRLTLEAADEENDIWIFDVGRGSLRRLTLDAGRNFGGVWFPDNDRVAFTREPSGGSEIDWQAADGSGVPRVLRAAAGEQFVPADVTPDGDTLLFSQGGPPRDIFMAPIGEPEAEPMPLIATPENELNAQVSPNGRWLAYQQTNVGQPEIWVVPFPVVDTGRWQISMGRGEKPRWSADGRELFYLVARADGSVALMDAAIESEPSFRAGDPVQLFAGDYYNLADGRATYDVAPDGERFLMMKDVGATESGAQPPRIIIVQNWIDELKRLVPTE